ncbi:hypothetical protein EXN66_Car003368 [Channa argus]|uniref:Uncharacterized protein n=1 Tax=Channa argus TaxID=215402 RepID=A0A6G1PCE1_CHAAH|nr:hypothetical protein EXN66_Car003368 [Channa argus]
MKLLVLVMCFLALSYALPVSEENDRVKRSSSEERIRVPQIPNIPNNPNNPNIPPSPPNTDLDAVLQFWITKLAGLIPAGK